VKTVFPGNVIKHEKADANVSGPYEVYRHLYQLSATSNIGRYIL